MNELVVCKWSSIGLKKNLNLTIEEKRMLIEANHPTISINRQCELVDLSRSSYYYKPKQCDENQLKLMRLIDERYTAYPREGARRIAKWLQNLGYEIAWELSTTLDSHFCLLALERALRHD